MNKTIRYWTWFFAPLVLAALLVMVAAAAAKPIAKSKHVVRQAHAGKRRHTSKSRRVLSLPDSSSKYGGPFIPSWKDNSHLWILKQFTGFVDYQPKSRCELKLWNIVSGEYKLVARFPAPDGPFSFFRPRSPSLISGYAHQSNSLVLIKNSKSQSINLGETNAYGQAERVWVHGKYLLFAQSPDYSEPEPMQIRGWDIDTGGEQEPLLINAPKGRHFTYQSDPGTGHGVGFGPILDLNLQRGIGAIATYTAWDDLGKNQLHLFNARTGQYLRHLKMDRRADIMEVLITPDGKKIITIGETVQNEKVVAWLQLWDAQSGKSVWRHMAKGGYSHGVISSDSKKLLLAWSQASTTGAWNYQALVWDMPTGNIQSKVKLNETPAALLISPDNQFIAVTDYDGKRPVTLHRLK
jgi:hypothetical protein